MVEAALLKGYSGTRGGQKGSRDVRMTGQIRYKDCLSILPQGYLFQESLLSITSDVEKVKGE